MDKLTNVAAEQQVVGACMADPAALDLAVSRIGPADFSDLRIGAIFSATARASLHGPATAIEVVEELRASGELEEAGGGKAVLWLAREAGGMDATNAAVKVVQELARKRDQLRAAYRAASTLAGGGDASAELAELAAAAPDDSDGWTDLGPIVEAILAGTHRRLEPSVLTRSDGAHLLYEARLNWLAAPPESMKSWVAKFACVQQMMLGRKSVYIDCEESDGVTCAERVFAIAAGLGVTQEVLQAWLEGPLLEDGTRNRSERLFYYRADSTGFGGQARAQVLRLVRQARVGFVVLDGFAAAMAAHPAGLEEDRARDVNLYLAGSIWPIVGAGAGVLVIDHVAKAQGGAGQTSFQQRGPRGSGAKLAAVSGVALRAEVVQAGSAYQPGRVNLWVDKDRPGRVRVSHRSGKRLAGVLCSTPQADGVIEVTRIEVLSPDEAAEEAAEKRWDLIAAELIVKLLAELGTPLSKTDLKELLNERRKAAGGTGWRGETMVKALDFLTGQGYASVAKEGRSEMVTRLRGYKADWGPLHADDAPPESPF